jgi:hypothetical protein
MVDPTGAIDGALCQVVSIGFIAQQGAERPSNRFVVARLAAPHRGMLSP